MTAVHGVSVAVGWGMLVAALLMAQACTSDPHEEKDTGGPGRPSDTSPEATDTADGDTGSDSDPVDSNVTDSVPSDPVDDCVGGDTGIAVMALFGGWSVPGGTFESAAIGYGAYGLCSEVYLCDLSVDYAALGPGQDNCPDCDWSFEVSPAPRPIGGDYCDRLITPSNGTLFFEKYTADELWLGDGRLNGLGTNPAYQYVPDDGGKEYFLGQTFFIHYTYGSYDGWYFMAWNFPDYGYYQVYGNSEAASFARVVQTSGHPFYYYYY